MTPTLAYDVYGTLIDTGAVVGVLRAHVGDRARAFSELWRSKQLEYAFRRGLMQRYRDFGVCTRDALAHACAAFGLRLGEGEREALLEAYRRLPPYGDAVSGLTAAEAAGMRLYAFSNGTLPAVSEVLGHAGLLGFFRDLVSVDEVQTFKPSPAVYAHFLKTAGAPAERTWLVSANPFDVLGAVSAGLRAVWVRRSADSLSDPWELSPSLTVSTLTEIPDRIRDAVASG